MKRRDTFDVTVCLCVVKYNQSVGIALEDCERAEASERDVAAKRLHSDFAATMRAEGLKADTPVRGARVAKYNQLMEIASENW